MSEAQHCPHCGAALPDGFEPPGEIGPPSDEALTAARPFDEVRGPQDFPAVSLLAPGSNDENFAVTPHHRRSSSTELDPILGAFVAPSSSVSATDGPKFASSRRPSSSANFPTLNLDATAGVRLAEASKPSTSGSDDDGVRHDDHRSPWGFVLLASYASAITLALGWTLIRDRGRDLDREKPEPVEPPPTVALPEQARQASLSRKVEPPEPIVGDHFAKLGQPLQIGSLEITPIEVRRQDVRLQKSNVFAESQRREGGKRALVLRLKLHNTSNDDLFAPLDQAYLRERGKEIVDTFVTTANNERIYPFPLAVESEWSIVGQDFTELRPGESRVVSIATAPDAPPDSAGPFTWRIRLRTGINRTDIIGLRWPEKPPAPARSKE